MTINEDRLDKLYLRTHKCLSHLENKNKNKKKETPGKFDIETVSSLSMEGPTPKDRIGNSVGKGGLFEDLR